MIYFIDGADFNPQADAEPTTTAQRVKLAPLVKRQHHVLADQAGARRARIDARLYELARGAEREFRGERG